MQDEPKFCGTWAIACTHFGGRNAAGVHVLTVSDGTAKQWHAQLVRLAGIGTPRKLLPGSVSLSSGVERCRMGEENLAKQNRYEKQR
jgi:hypothetical protein